MSEWADNESEMISRLISESQQAATAPSGVWVREATPEEVDLLRAALDAHRRALDMEAQRAMDFVVLVALGCIGFGFLLGWLAHMAVEG